MTRVDMASTIGTARGRTQASCRPRPWSSVSEPVLLTVGCGVIMVAVGLKAIRKTIASPFEIPPWMYGAVGVIFGRVNFVVALAHVSVLVRPVNL